MSCLSLQNKQRTFACIKGFMLWGHSNAMVYTATPNNDVQLREDVFNACYHIRQKQGVFQRMRDFLRCRAEGFIAVNCCCCCLFSDGHVLQLWIQTVAVRRRMNYGVDDIWWPNDTRGRMWAKFPDICLTVEEKPRINLNQEIDPT